MMNGELGSVRCEELTPASCECSDGAPARRDPERKPTRPFRQKPQMSTLAVAALVYPTIAAVLATNAAMMGFSAPASQTRVNPKDGLTYVWVPPGRFIMGCSTGDAECVVNERPAHPVLISKGFWIGQTEVTQQAYERVAHRTPNIFFSNPGNFRGPLLPVNLVDWFEATAYCRAIGMRLPTEAEWEYAARGGVASSTYGKPKEVAWFEENSEKQIHEPGQKQANGYGLFDMLGNVSEWTADWYRDNYDSAKPVTDPQGPAQGDFRVIRGGSWQDNSRSVRLSSRYRFDPASGFYDLGFRCAGQ